ncbi:MAG TPA: FmdB family transcriptional regulator [Dehalococcoidia bacterium]|nr:FmdB family transcriptional regulator [Dehalococcoidia bacterium]
MPRYDYRCESCKEEFELRQTFAEAGKGTCPLCSGKGQRVYHAVPVIYKGSGFYTTDYGRPKPPVEKSESSSSDSKSSTDSKSSSDSKSDSNSSSSSSSDSSSSSSDSSSSSSDSSAKSSSDSSSNSTSSTPASSS